MWAFTHLRDLMNDGHYKCAGFSASPFPLPTKPGSDISLAVKSVAKAQHATEVSNGRRRRLRNHRDYWLDHPWFDSGSHSEGYYTGQGSWGNHNNDPLGNRGCHHWWIYRSCIVRLWTCRQQQW